MSERRGKYNASPTMIDGIRFASKREAARYCELRLLEKAGEISGLRCQVPYDLVVNGKKVCRYVADFWYLERGAAIVEDCKGMRTQVYSIKCKLMKACFGITIRET